MQLNCMICVVQLRHSTARFEMQVADVLLSVALTDKEFHIRHSALVGYKKHPHGGDIQVLIDAEYGR